MTQKTKCQHLIQQITAQIIEAQEKSLLIHFLWIPSHIGLAANDTVDTLAKNACTFPLLDSHTTPSLLCYKRIIYSGAFLATSNRRNTERAQSVSVQHYDYFLDNPHKYRRHGLMIRKNNIVSARLRLGYRPVWQILGAGEPHYSSCKLCDASNANNLYHYCRVMLPQEQSLISICVHLLTDNNLDIILMRHPHFGGC